jgi:hypothetical protein
MRYIKKFNEAFDVKKENQPVEVASDMTSFNDTEKWIKDFNTRKAILSGIYLNYKDDSAPSDKATPIDLYNKLVAGKFIKPSNAKSELVFFNPLFNIWGEICKKNRQLKIANTTLSQKKQDITNKQSEISAGTGDVASANTDIETANNDMKAQLDNLTLIKKEIANLQKASADELKNKSLSLQTSKKRITKLDIPPA